MMVPLTMCNDNSLSEKLSDGLEKVVQIFRHTSLVDGLPCFLQQNHFVNTIQFSHPVDEDFHDEGDNREQYLVVLDIVQLEDNKSFGQQNKLPVGV